ncbi:hypothetical protein HRG_014756 [Hirsutella rhossiliensis]
MRDQETDQPQTLDCIKRRLVHRLHNQSSMVASLRTDALSVMHMRVSTIQALPSDSHTSLPRISFVAKVSDLLRKHDSCYRLSGSHMSIPGKRFVYVGAGDPFMCRVGRSRPKISKVCLGSIYGLLNAADEEKNKSEHLELNPDSQTNRLRHSGTNHPRANDRSIVSSTIDRHFNTGNVSRGHVSVGTMNAARKEHVAPMKLRA